MPNENIFPSPWNSFMLKYHSFQSAQILLGWIMRQMENRKGGASSKCFMLGRINELCRFQPPPTLLIWGHLPLILGRCKHHRSHIKLHPPPTQPIQRAAVCPRLSMTHSKEKVCPGKASRLWALATCRTLPEASTIFQKDYQSAVWVLRKWKIARNSLSVSEQTNARSSHQLNSWLNQVHSLVLLVTWDVSVGSP